MRLQVEWNSDAAIYSIFIIIKLTQQQLLQRFMANNNDNLRICLMNQ